MIIFHPGIVIVVIDFSGFSPAFFCHDSISDADQFPDALITENGYELLSSFAPRKIEDIEKLIAEKSAVDDFKLPALKSADKKGF